MLAPQITGVWPPPARVSLSRSTRGDQSEFLVVPTLSHPRLLVPLGVPGADRMLTRHGGSRAQLAAWTLWRGIHRSRAAARLPLRRLAITPEPDGIEAHLAAALSQPVRVGVLLGPPRANLKPVLQVFDAAGATVAFAKLALTPLANDLLVNETAALTTLGGIETRTFTAPQLLHSGQWRNNRVLVQQALPLSQSNLAPVEPPVTVMAEIAGIGATSTRGLRGSEFLGGVKPPSAPLWHGVDMQPFVRLHAALSATAADCTFGSWHGDFGPWNMATDGARVEVWDWERFEEGVPVGLDAAHYRTQVGVASQQEPQLAWPAITRDVAGLLAAMGLNGDVASPVAASYLLAITARYRRDADSGPTSALRRRLQWLAATASVAVASIERPPA